MWEASKDLTGTRVWINLETSWGTNDFSLNVFQFYSIWGFFALQRWEHVSYFRCHSTVIEQVIKSSVYRCSLKHSIPSHDLWQPHKRPIYHTLRGSAGQGYTVCVRLYRPCMLITSGNSQDTSSMFICAQRCSQANKNSVYTHRATDGPLLPCKCWIFFPPVELLQTEPEPGSFYSRSLKYQKCIKSV